MNNPIYDIAYARATAGRCSNDACHEIAIEAVESRVRALSDLIKAGKNTASGVELWAKELASHRAFLEAQPGRVVRFRVVAVSSNRNSFGLHGVIMISETGVGMEVGTSAPPAVESDVYATVNPRCRDEGRYVFNMAFEIPRLLPTPPEAVVRTAWERLP
jgi:hypothetical protein